MIHQDLDLFYGICNRINQHYQKQINYFLLIILSIFDISVTENQKVLERFHAFHYQS